MKKAEAASVLVLKESAKQSLGGISTMKGFGRSWFEAAEPFEGLVHRILHTRVWTMQHASYLRYGFGELIAIRLIS